MAFIQFSKINRPKFQRDNPELSFGDMSKLVGQKWKSLSAEEKVPYQEMHEEQKKQRDLLEPKKKSKKAKVKGTSNSKSAAQMPQTAQMTPYEYYGGAVNSAPDNAWLSAYSLPQQMMTPTPYNNNQSHGVLQDQRYPAGGMTGHVPSGMPWPVSAGHIPVPTGMPWPVSNGSLGTYAENQSQPLPVPTGLFTSEFFKEQTTPGDSTSISNPTSNAVEQSKDEPSGPSMNIITL